MVPEPTPSTAVRCTGCGYEAPADSDRWETVDHPPLGTMTRCPECGSTDVHTRG